MNQTLNSPPRHEGTKKRFSPPSHQATKKTFIRPIPSSTNKLATQVVDAAYKVHVALGPGLLESVYEACLVHELLKRGLKAERQIVLPVIYDGIPIDAGLRLDIVVGGAVVVELKAVEKVRPVHQSLVLTYLKLSGHRVALLINFNVSLIRDGIFRIVL